MHLLGLFIKEQTIIGALSHTAAASSTHIFVNRWLTICMLLFLTSTRTASHTDVLNRTTKSCRLMPFKMA